jgi:hypothetical protein
MEWNDSLLGYSAIKSCWIRLPFQGCVLPQLPPWLRQYAPLKRWSAGQYIPEGCHLYTGGCENLKSYMWNEILSISSCLVLLDFLILSDASQMLHTSVTYCNMNTLQPSVEFEDFMTQCEFRFWVVVQCRLVVVHNVSEENAASTFNHEDGSSKFI